MVHFVVVIIGLCESGDERVTRVNASRRSLAVAVDPGDGRREIFVTRCGNEGADGQRPEPLAVLEIVREPFRGKAFEAPRPRGSRTPTMR